MMTIILFRMTSPWVLWRCTIYIFSFCSRFPWKMFTSVNFLFEMYVCVGQKWEEGEVEEDERKEEIRREIRRRYVDRKSLPNWQTCLLGLRSFSKKKKRLSFASQVDSFVSSTISLVRLKCIESLFLFNNTEFSKKFSLFADRNVVCHNLFCFCI